MRHLVCILASLILMGAAKPSAPSEVTYTLSPIFNDGRLDTLEVTMRLRAAPGGVTTLKLPDQNGGVSTLWRYLKDIEVQGAKRFEQPDQATRIIHAAAGTPLTIRYRVVSAFDHDPTASEFDTYKPTIRPRWFWVYGEALFIHPRDSAHYRARFTWTGAPDYPFASDLERPGSMSIDELTESVVIGGPDMRLNQRMVSGTPLRVAVVGQFSFTDDALADTLERVVGAERDFWRAKGGPFLVALAPLVSEPRSMSIRGEGRRDAFAIMSSTDTTLKASISTFAHEYFHTWNPQRLGGMQSGDKQRLDYWFSEGFTDYYARRLLLRMGEFSLEDFVAKWNEMLGLYAGSSAHSAPNSRVREAFWTNYDVEKLPYQRGALLAAKWDDALRRRSNGRTNLDDVMRAMRDEAQKTGTRGPTAPELFIRTARRFGLDPAPDIDRVITQGGSVLLPPSAFGPCLTIVNSESALFDRGFDLDATIKNHGVLTGLEPGGPAERAGLREGMRIGVNEVRSNDPGEPLTYTVKRDDGVLAKITYLPEGREKSTRQQIVLPMDLTPEGRAACIGQAAGAALGDRRP